MRFITGVASGRNTVTLLPNSGILLEQTYIRNVSEIHSAQVCLLLPIKASEVTVFRSTRTSCRTFYSRPPVRPTATNFPAFIDKLSHCRQTSGTPQTIHVLKAHYVSYSNSEENSNTETNPKTDTNKGSS